jgi:hypothetical protein
MTTQIQRRWGILSLAVFMFFVTLIISIANGGKASIYYLVWFMVGYYAFKDKLDEMKFMMKIVIFINISVAAAVFVFADKDFLRYFSSESKIDFLINVFIMLIPKVFIYFYCANKLSKETLNLERADSIQESNEVNPIQPIISKQVQQASKSSNSMLSDSIGGVIKGFKDGWNDAGNNSKAEFFDVNGTGSNKKTRTLSDYLWQAIFSLIIAAGFAIGIYLYLVVEVNLLISLPCILGFIVFFSLSIIYAIRFTQVVDERGISIMDFFWELVFLAAFVSLAVVLARKEGYLFF